MGLFDIFRKKEKEPSVTDGLRTKTVNYVAVDIVSLADEIKRSDEALLRLEPVNYYAIKNSYIEAVYFTSEDLDRIFVAFRLMETVREHEKCTARTEIYPVSAEVYKKAMLRLGVTL